MENKQETELKQAAEKYRFGDPYNNFLRGAEWMQERMYSEEEVLDLLAGFVDSRGEDFVPFKDIQKWFEKFKKK
jgi:hypothetical protein